MSRQAIDGFFQRIGQDENLEETYWTTVEDATRNAVVKLAAELGFDFTADELKKAMEDQTAGLDEDSLDQVTGGIGGSPAPSLRAHGDPGWGRYLPLAKLRKQSF